MKSDLSLIQNAIEARIRKGSPSPHSALRLFNGFLEGLPDIQIELFADTILVTNFARDPNRFEEFLPTLQTHLLEIIPTCRCLLLKERNTSRINNRKGRILFGSSPADRIVENDVKYKLDLTLNQDSSFYLDTRNLRVWLKSHANRWEVLNTFAYTGSLGIACLAGGASQVIQTDRTRRFLEVAEKGCELNGFSLKKQKVQPGDFFSITSRYRQNKETFDCVIIDPPFFSTSSKGTVDLQSQYQRISNKVRPLVRDNGFLIAINNSLFLSGLDYLNTLEKISSDGFVKIEKIIPVPDDITGYPETIKGSLPVDPAPFNHSTKIAVLKIKRK
jgi:23S rRNA (cytosine1962-C5)-methyltransferase